MSDKEKITGAEDTQMPAWARELVTEVSYLKKRNKMLEDMAGKNKIASWDESQKDKKQKFAHLKVYDGNVVIGWSNLDYSEFNPRAADAISEKIHTELIFLDGSKRRVNYAMFNNGTEEIKVKIIEFGADICTIEFDDTVVAKYGLGKNTLSIHTKFLNA